MRSLKALAAERDEWRRAGERVVWTNGCFDVFHAGHVRALETAKAFGDRLIVGLNSDRSVQGLKGEGRPLCNETDRAAMLSALEAVDRVVLFDGIRCVEELRSLRPDVWTKSGDYTLETLDQEERAAVEAYGGRIELTPLIPGISTTLLVKKIRRLDPEKIVSAACGFLRDDAGRLLLVATRYADSVKWGLPGGGHERGEPLAETVRREMREETGLEVEVGRHMGVIERVDAGMAIHLVLHMFEVTPAAGTNLTGDFSGRSDEYVTEAKWFTREMLQTEPGIVMGRRLWLDYGDKPEQWPPYILMRPGEE